MTKYYPRKQAAPPTSRKNKGTLGRGLTKSIKKKARKAIDKSQSTAIMKLSKQVKSLQMSKYGKRQQNFQTVVSPLQPRDDRPIMFDLTDFTCQNSALNAQGCRVFSLDAAGIPSVITNWEVAQQIGNPFWQNQNLDIVDTGSFFPRYAKLTLKFTGRPNLVDTRIRVDLVSLKAAAFKANNPGDPTLVPPASLPYLQNLATPTLNRISREYFHIYQTKFVYMNSAVGDPDVANSVKGTTGNTKWITMEVRPKKARYQSRTFPIASTLQPTVPQVEPQFGAFGPTNSPIDQPLWVIISINNPGGTDPGDTAVICTASRFVQWSDTIGSGNM